MAEALAGALPIAVSILAVPLPIAAVIVLLVSARAKVNGLAFAGGRVLGNRIPAGSLGKLIG